MARDKIDINDRQLACARINSQEGQDYLKAMACAANFAWVNRSSMTFLVRQAFAKMFKTTPDDLDMHLVYDVSHNIAKVPLESHTTCCASACVCGLKQRLWDLMLCQKVHCHVTPLAHSYAKSRRYITWPSPLFERCNAPTPSLAQSQLVLGQDDIRAILPC